MDAESEYLLGIHDFTARSDDEMSLSKGDHIRVLETDRAFGDGWYIGHNLMTGQAGLFPKVFTTALLVPPQDQEQYQQQQQQQQQQQSQSHSQQRTSSTGSPISPYPQSQPSPQSSQPPVLHHRPSVHDTLTDIDEAISEINSYQHQSRQHQHHQQRHANSSNSSSSNGHQKSANGVHRRQSSGTSSGNIPAALVDSGLDFDNIPKWSPLEVQKYFDLKGYDPGVTSQFVHHKITGSILLELELSYLKEIDIASFGTRFEISKDIKQLNAIMHKRSMPSHSHISSSSSTASRTQRHAQSNSGGSNGAQTTSNEAPLSSSASNTGNGKRQGGLASPFAVSRTSSLDSQGHRRDPSFDKNWIHPRTEDTIEEGDSESSAVSEDEDEEQSSAEDRQPRNDAAANPSASSPARSKRLSFLSKSHKRNSVSAGTMQDILDMRYRNSSRHSRNPSYDTVRASIHETSLTSRHSHNLSASSFSKRRSQSISSSQFDLSGTRSSGLESKGTKRRSTLLSALLGSGGLGSTPSSPNHANLNRSPRPDEYGSTPTFVDSPDAGGDGDDANYQDYNDVYDVSGESSLQSPQTPSQDENSSGFLENGTKSASSGGTKASTPGSQTPAKFKGSAAFGRMKTLRQVSSHHNLRRPLKKQNTSAFMEGIKSINPNRAKETADFSGWMKKRGGVGVGAWKSRFFTLHGTRLSYFTSMNETKERGLIDITSHRVLPARENEDKLLAFYAASVGAGRHCFKLVPPAPGTRKGVTFTAPKVHYFAVESREEMRQWMAALMKATIDRDDSKPVLTSCVTPTVPLPKAREMMQEAKVREEEFLGKMAAGQDSSSASTAGRNNLERIDSESPESSRSSHTGSTNTNSSSLRATSSNGTSPNDDPTVRHLTTKTAGLKVVTNLETA